MLVTKKYVIVFLLLLSGLNYILGQNVSTDSEADIITKNNFYVSAGSSLIFSAFTVVYERNIISRPLSEWNIRGGWGMNAPLWGIVMHHYLVDLCYISGKSNHHFEACFGVTMFFDQSYFKYYKNDPDLYEPFSYFTDWYPSAYLGYRYKKPGGKFLFRVGLGWPEQFGVGVGFCI
ncbi:MAG TPA: hypothetical protein PKN32_06065 [Bacteroidales bacterium]|nr:hypothetical protein [Bacteroidales bacterium]